MRIPTCPKNGLMLGHGYIYAQDKATLTNMLNHSRHEINGHRIRLRFFDKELEQKNQGWITAEMRQFNRGREYQRNVSTFGSFKGSKANRTEFGELVHEIIGSKLDGE